MLGYVAIVHMYSFKHLIFSLKARRGAQTQNCSRQNSAQCYTARSHVYREYLREKEFFSKTILDCLSGTQMSSIYAKIEVENLVTQPLKKIFAKEWVPVDEERSK